MSRIISFILSIFIAICNFFGLPISLSQDDVIILFTNDVHCAADENIGYAGLAAYKKECLEKTDYVTLVDCGDHLQGSYLGTVSKGSCMVEIMNEVGYDYAVFGNHEFDYGFDILKENIEKSNLQYLCCNITYSGSKENKLKDVKPYEVVEYGGIKVGYIGISTPYTPINSTPAFFAEDGKQVYYFGIEKTVSEFYDGIQQTIDDCRNDGADYVVALSHMGIEEECKPYRSSDLIANTTGIDVVLDGHSHTEMTCNVVGNKTGEPVLLSQTGTKFSSIGKLMITASGNISVGLISEYEKKDAETEKFVGDVLRKYNGEMNKVIGHTDVSMPIADESGIRMVRSRELAIGDMVADAYRIISGADIGMCNGGGIRASINEGDITYADIINVNPYGNTLCVVKLTGAEIVDMLEYFYRFTRNVYSENGVAVGEYGSFQQVSGLKFVVDTSKEASVETDADDNLISVSEINRISDVKVLQSGEYVPIDLEKTYTVASHNYMIKNGGSGMLYFLDGKELVVDESVMDYQLLIEYFEYLGNDFSQYGTVDNRITIR